MTEGAAQPPRPSAPGSEELLRNIIDSARDFAIFAMDSEGRVTSWNTGAERLLGYAEDEILGRSADVLFTAEDRAAGTPERERRQARQEGRAEDERWKQRKDGSRFWASGLVMPLDEPAAGFVKILRDQTERHRTIAQLRENEERFRLLATNIPQLVFRCQFDGSRIWGSPQWIEFTGLDLEHSVGFGWLDALHPDDRERTVAAWDEARRSGGYYVEHRVRRQADGEYRWHQTRASPVRGGSDDMSGDWVGTSSDVHDLRGLQDRQHVLMAELQHRTRNLLAVVQSIANQTLRNAETLPRFGREFQSRLGALGRVQALVSRADQEDIRLRDLLTAELAAHGGTDSAKVQIAGPEVALPATSAQALGLALHELATNAVKFGALAQDTGRLTVMWRIEEDARERRLALDWQETGVALRDREQRRRGYGSELIERALPYQLGAPTRLEFAPDGVRCAIAVPLRQ